MTTNWKYTTANTKKIQKWHKAYILRWTFDIYERGKETDRDENY